jgi:ABC-type uncharacterized transport system fused permease/ATPase subunit
MLAARKRRIAGRRLLDPDPRIAEDLREYVASTLGLSLSPLSAFVTLLSFGGLLWSLSRHVTFDLAGSPLRVPSLLPGHTRLWRISPDDVGPASLQAA